MASELEHSLVSFSRTAEETRRRLAQACSGPACPESRLGMSLQPGTLVYDLVTGKTGVVHAGATETYLVPPPER